MANEPICSVETCDKPAQTRGWCERHYRRWVRHGDPLVAKRRWRNSTDPMPPAKVCTKCRVSKPLEEFSADTRSGTGVREVCKECCRADGFAYRDSNVGRERERGRKYHRTNPSAALERNRRWRAANLERARERDRVWRAANPDKTRAMGQRHYAKVSQSSIFRINNSIKACIGKSVRRGTKARRQTETLLGYSFEKLRAHLERQFTKGMTWESYGHAGWHIDHILPLSSFNYETPDDPEFRAAWALSNLRPLWARENFSKHAKRLHLI
jgi:hypothetical protein